MKPLEKLAVTGLLVLAPTFGSCTSRYERMGLETCGPQQISDGEYAILKLREEEQKKKKNRVYIDLEKFTQD